MIKPHEGTVNLIETLGALASFLRRHGETHWASWLESDVERLRAGDLGGVTHFLSAYGGMGSFTDLVLHPANGHRVEIADVARVDAALSDLRSRAWRLADQLSREAIRE